MMTPEIIEQTRQMDRPLSLAVLAAEQGVGPVTDFEAIKGDFWPADESVDDFLAARTRWNEEGHLADRAIGSSDR